MNGLKAVCVECQSNGMYMTTPHPWATEQVDMGYVQVSPESMFVAIVMVCPSPGCKRAIGLGGFRAIMDCGHPIHTFGRVFGYAFVLPR